MSESIEHAGAAVVDAADGLAGHLAAVLGGEHVLTDATSRRLHAQDVHGSGVPPLALVRPGLVDEPAVAVRLVTAGCLALMFAGGVMLATLHAKLAMPALYLFGLGWGGDYTMLQGLVAILFVRLPERAAH